MAYREVDPSRQRFTRAEEQIALGSEHLPEVNRLDPERWLSGAKADVNSRGLARVNVGEEFWLCLRDGRHASAYLVIDLEVVDGIEKPVLKQVVSRVEAPRPRLVRR